MSMGVSKGQKCLESLWIVLVSIIVFTYFETKTSVELKSNVTPVMPGWVEKKKHLQIEECRCPTTNVFSNFQVLS